MKNGNSTDRSHWGVYKNTEDVNSLQMISISYERTNSQNDNETGWTIWKNGSFRCSMFLFFIISWFFKRKGKNYVRTVSK